MAARKQVKARRKAKARKAVRGRRPAKTRRRAAIAMPALDPATVPGHHHCDYPSPFREPCIGRVRRKLGDATGLTQFGVNHVTLPPGVMSSMRHWHVHEDEFVYVLTGELVLVTDRGEQLLKAGMAAGFPHGRTDGHHLINRSKQAATFLEVGTRWPGGDEGAYSDIDMKIVIVDGEERYARKDGTLY